MKTCFVKAFLLWTFLSAPMLLAQAPSDGIWQGYDGEWKHVSQQLVALAEATPADKFAWRPAPGVRSTSVIPNPHCIRACKVLLCASKAPDWWVRTAHTGIIFIAEDLAVKDAGTSGWGIANAEFCWPYVIQMFNQLRQGERATPD